MTKNRHDVLDADFLKYLQSGRDALELLDFSLSGASNTPDKKIESIISAREGFDPATGKKIDRSWEIAFSAKYGRPTLKDDDVLLALLKISSEDNFKNQRVYFSRAKICQINDWSAQGDDYKAIANALDRLQGIRITGRNYDYDEKRKIWKERRFGIINESEIYNKEQISTARGATDGEVPESWFEWSAFMMESFNRNQLRKIDLDVLRSFQNPMSKKLFRNLGKNFWHKRVLPFDMKCLAIEILGYKKGTPLTEIRRALKPVFAELVEKKVYGGLNIRTKDSYGKCEVTFVIPQKLSSKKARQPELTKPSNTLFDQLVKLHINEGDARKALRAHSDERIIEDLEDLEYRDKHGMIKESKSGLLYSMLQSKVPFERPKGFVSRVMKKKQQAAKQKLIVEKDAAIEEKELQEQEMVSKENTSIEKFLASLPDDQARIEFEEQAVQENPYLGKYYLTHKATGGSKFQQFRKALLLEAIEKHAA